MNYAYDVESLITMNLQFHEMIECVCMQGV